MADRSSHYEASFEHVLRERGVPYVAVDEAKRALFGKASLKGFDFLVYCDNGPNLLVDVKGRKLAREHSVQTWVTRRDVDDLAQWERVFGNDFRAVFAFAFDLGDEADAPGTALPQMPPEPGVHVVRGRRYRMMAVGLGEYREHMRRRSEKWETVAVPAADFRRLARAIETWL